MMSYLRVATVLMGLMASVVGGCTGGEECEPTAEMLCLEGELYWMNSCGEADDLIKHCECGCKLDHSDCLDCDCVPDCAGRECGPDPVCGAISCGECQDGLTCNDEGWCEGGCIPDCAGKECGSDGCGDNHNCGECDAGWTCNRIGKCVRPETCNNGELETYEECEGFELRGQTCESLGFDDGNLACHDDCILDTSQCRKCGNNVAEPGEACDGADLGEKSCQSLGFVGGTLSCRPDCMGVDTLECHYCGNGIIDDGETCDGPDLDGQTCESLHFTGGTLVCAENCRFLDISGCIGNPCDDSYSCSNCLECALNQFCVDLAMECMQHSECGDYVSCIYQCEEEATPEVCFDQCSETFEEGKPRGDTYLACLYCDGCPNDCAGASIMAICP
jgi:hypothetical protein